MNLHNNQTIENRKLNRHRNMNFTNYKDTSSRVNIPNTDKDDIRFDNKGIQKEVLTRKLEVMLPNIIDNITANINDEVVDIVDDHNRAIKQENSIRSRLNLKPI
jgi:hypothetical protein